MKNTLIIALTFISVFLSAQSSEDVKEWNLSTADIDQVLLFNKYGDVKITGTSEDRIKLKVKRTLKSKNRNELAKAKSEIYLDTMMLEGNLYFFVQHPQYILEINEVGGSAWYNSRNQGKWRWSNNNNDAVKYEMTIEMQIPKSMDLRAYTHKKDLTINGINSMLNAGVHHGKLELNNVKNLRSAHGHHGDIEVTFSEVPEVNGEYNTHHGDIKLSFPNTPSANVSMDSHHGSFFTDFDWTPLAMKALKSKSQKGTTYHIGKNTSVKFGNGTHDISMKSHHGDIYILKR